MPGRSREDVVLVARIAAAERWARTVDRSAATAPARAAAWERFERLVDPDGVLTPDERRSRAQDLRRANMLRLSRLAAQRRSERAGHVP